VYGDVFGDLVFDVFEVCVVGVEYFVCGDWVEVFVGVFVLWDVE